MTDDVVHDVSGDLGYYQLLERSEKARWIMHDLPWSELDPDKVTPELVEDVKIAAFAELTTYSATEAFMKLFTDDIDFTQWLSVWFYEETKHPLVLIKWLAAMGVPTEEAFVYRGREIEPMTNSKVEMLTSNICSEIAANTAYRLFGKAVEEPVLVSIMRYLARDEMRHSNGFQFYCRKTIERSDDPERDRLRALRVVWFLLQPSSDGVTQHPVFKTLLKMEVLDVEVLQREFREKIVQCISRVLDLDIPSPEAFYDVYAKLKKDYRARRSSRALQ
ncbi:hypothetical protein L861_17260 [Litchfieldella anticariensis FP35 = DSM 16096]|uniref:Ferritin n=2 Tax=Litchfieldella anticariensis TaxID=258591 RepID=S2LEZ1_LITA3|nr:ferritin-like domain-containing protein [Halomonas anticariensis]EPC03291.1 hypothetical protein L861_17260 [Halomonas anticariensis FP35 = DSM 16096]